jgi:hypothetical protein
MAPAVARAVLESLLRERKLDTTLTSALPAGLDEERLAPSGLAALDTHLSGGLPRGHVSEITGPRSAGRTSLLVSLMAAATARGEIVALVDTLDRFDAASAEAAGVCLSRVLWIRGHDVSLSRRVIAPEWEPSRPRPGRTRASLVDRALDRAIKALNLVVQAGGFGLVAIDLADVPPLVVRGLPFTTWLRLQRTIEGSDTACVLTAAEPTARSAGGVSIRLDPRRGGDADALSPCALPFASTGLMESQTSTLMDSRTSTLMEPRTFRSGGCVDRQAATLGRRPHGQTVHPAGEIEPGPRAFHRGVLASRRPFVGSGVRSPAGRWATARSGEPRRLRGLSVEAAVVRADRQAQSARRIALEFGD